MENSLDCGFSNTSACVIKEFSFWFINDKENTTAVLVQKPKPYLHAAFQSGVFFISGLISEDHEVGRFGAAEATS